MKFRVNHQQSHHGMNLVPLIDVLLILLIFFIVTNAMARFETELEISVPAADTMLKGMNGREARFKKPRQSVEMASPVKRSRSHHVAPAIATKG